MKILLKVDTWLPMFSGFYGTIWETDNDEENEMDNINSIRREKGLPAIEWDAIEWDYEGYTLAVSEGMTDYVGGYLKDAGFIKDYSFQKLVSPREYNFTNDSINVAFTLDAANVKKISRYLSAHSAEFAKYIQERYTSCSGFISSYSNASTEWVANLEQTLSDQHKLGSVLNFIIENEEGEDFEMDAYEDVTGNEVCLTASNYTTLTAAR